MKYYTEEQIEKENLHFVSTRNRLLVSNNHELPEKELQQLATINNMGSIFAIIFALLFYCWLDIHLFNHKIWSAMVDLLHRYTN